MVSAQIKTIMEKSNTEYGKFGRGGALMNITPKVTTVDEVYTELIQLRNKNRALEGRIKQLENQNFSMTQQNFAKDLHTPKLGAKNIEPGRPHFNLSQQPLRAKFGATGVSGTMSGQGSPAAGSDDDEMREAKQFSAAREQQWKMKAAGTDRPPLPQAPMEPYQRHSTINDGQMPSQFARPMPLLNNNNGYQSEGVGTVRKHTPVV